MAIRQLYSNWWGGLVALSPDEMMARLRRDLADGMFTAFYILNWDFTGFVTTKPVDITDLLADPPGTPPNWSATQRIAAMFRRIPGCMTTELRKTAAALLTPKAIALLAALTVALAASQAFVVGEMIDGLLMSAAWAYMRWQGLLALKDLIAAIIDAAGETTLPGIQADAQTAAHALGVLGMNFLNAIVLRAADQEKVISLEKPPPDEPLLLKKPAPVAKGLKDFPSTTEPANTGAVKGALSGTPTKIPPLSDAATARALNLENESAVKLSQNGYNVVQNPTVAGLKNPDYLIDGEIFDNYAPSTNNVRNIATTIEGKVTSAQAPNMVINLTDSAATPAQLQEQITNYPISGLQKVIVIDQSGNVSVINGAGQ
jgi:hypothetical protein